MNFKGESRFDAALVADAGANPASSNYLVAAIPSIVRIAFGGTTVAIARVIEGHTEYSGCSDLSPSSTLSGGVEADPNSRNCFGNASNPLVVSGHAQRMTHTSLKTAIDIAGVAPRPLNFPNGSMRVFHGAGITEEENKAGQHSNTAHTSSLRLKAKGRMARSGEQRTGRQGATISGRFACNLGNPYVEKEARLRPQHFTFGSGAGLNNQGSLWKN